MICALCGTEHDAHQAQRFVSDTNMPVVVANKVANKRKPAMVANTSRHGQYADKAKRREYMRAYMRTYMSAKRKASA